MTTGGDPPPAVAIGAATGRRRAATWNLVFSYANLGVGLVGAVILVPVYLRHIDLATYGAWLASGNVVALAALLDLGLNLVLAQRLSVAATRGDRQTLAYMAGTGLAISMGSAAALVLAALAAAPWIPRLVGCPAEQIGDLRLAFYFAAAGAGLGLLQQTFGALLQSWQVTVSVGASNVLASCAGLAATVGGLLAGLGVVALGLGSAVRALVGTVGWAALAVSHWRRFDLPRPRVRTSEARALMRLAGPVFLSRVGSSVVSNSEAFVVAILVDPTAAAILSLTGRALTFGGMLLAPIGSAAFAGIARLAAEGSAERVVTVVKELLFLSSLAAALVLGGALALNEPFVGLWVGRDKFGGLGLTALIASAIVLSTRANLLGLVLSALGRPADAAWASLAEAMLRIPLTVALVSGVGIAGVPLGTAMSVLLTSGWMNSRRLAVRTSHGTLATWWLQGAGSVGPSFALALVVAAASVRAPSWSMFAGLAAAAGAALVLLNLLTSERTRSLAAALGGRLVGRWR